MKNVTTPSGEQEGDAVAGHVRIFDTTLRDGEQAPGFSMDLKAKVRMAAMLEALGVDVLEAGFPQASPDDFAATAAVAKAVRGKTTVCALARCRDGDIDVAGRAVEGARRSRIHVFIATSPLHREYKLNMSKQQVLAAAVASVERARALCDEVEFSAEDSMRTEPEYLAEVLGAVIAAGATTVNCPDTVGYMIPAEIAGRFAWLRSHVKGASGVVFSCHCHDDLGMGVANSLAAVSAGARQVECTINGIGERAGNAALEEIVMALKVRAAYFGATARLDTTKLYPASRLLSELTGQSVQANKAIVGRNAFAHESGIHQDGMLKNPNTYEIMRPQDVGAESTLLVLGKHSGRAALRQRLEALGYAPDDAQLKDVFTRFKVLADKQHEIHDQDLERLAQDSAVTRATVAKEAVA
jgi:2-isopropylmalate synthase